MPNSAVEEAKRDLVRGDAIALEAAPARPLTHEDAETAEAVAELARQARVAARTGPADDPDHKAKQAAYRAWMAQVEPGEEKVDVVIEPTEETEQAVQSAEERAAAILLAWEAEYAEAVEKELSSGSPVYVVGNRPPRPKWHGQPLPLGGVVPGASRFPRLETWVSTGVLVRRG